MGALTEARAAAGRIEDDSSVAYRDKRIGPRVARYAFESYPTDDLDGLRRAVADVLSELDELTVLARAVRLSSDHNPERAAVRTPGYRRELTVLARDL